MMKNMGSADRVIRGVLGIAILCFGYLRHSWWGLIGVVPLATALVAWCPLYTPFKFSTGAKSPTPKAG